MNQETGRFVDVGVKPSPEREKGLETLRNILAKQNPQYVPGKHQDPCLGIGEEFEIEGTKLRVSYIKADGRLGAFICERPEGHDLSYDQVVEIKKVKFKVTRISRDGKVGLRMLNAANIADQENP